MKRPGPVGAAALLLGLCLFLYFWGLGNLPFFTKGEPREGLQVWEEVHHGEWILPLRNGTEIPSKPPLFHWIGGLLSLLLGRVDELTVRLPSAIFATLGVLLVFWHGYRRWDANVGLYAGAITATSFEWIRSATHARVDMVLATCLIATYVALERVLSAEKPERGPLIALYLSMGLAALAKGPVGFVLPGLVTLVYLACRRDLWRLLDMRLVTGGLVTLAIAGSWYAAAIATAGDEFVMKQLWKENVGRFFAADESGAGHVHPWHYMIPAFFGGYMPWSVFVIPLGVWLWDQRNHLERRHMLFPLAWFATIYAFYSLSEGKRSVYLLPTYPAVSLVLGVWWNDLVRRSSQMPAAVVSLFRVAAVLVGALLLVTMAILVGERFGVEPLSWLAPILHEKDAANLPVVQRIMRQRFEILLLWLVLLLPVIGLLFASVRQKRWLPVLAALVGFIASTVAIIHAVFHPAIAWARTFKPLMTVVRDLVGPEDELVFYEMFDYSVVFYSRRHIPAIDTIPPAPDDHHLYVLFWEETWDGLDPAEKSRLELLRRSTGTGPKGDTRLILTMVKAPLPSPTEARSDRVEPARSSPDGG